MCNLVTYVYVRVGFYAGVEGLKTGLTQLSQGYQNWTPEHAMLVLILLSRKGSKASTRSLTVNCRLMLRLQRPLWPPISSSSLSESISAVLKLDHGSFQ